MVELLVALTLVLVIAGGVTAFVHEASHAAAAQPGAADLVQRLRATRAALTAELQQAGAGLTRVQTDAAGPLGGWVPPVLPRRVGLAGGDPDSLAFDDRLTIISVPDGSVEAPIDPMGSPGDPLVPQPGPWCNTDSPACGFRADRPVLVFDRLARFALVGEATVFPAALQPSTPLPAALGIDPVLSEVRVVSYRFDPSRRQLRRALGGNELPAVDDVVGFGVEYYGHPFPPTGPRPPPGVATCVIDADGGARLPVLTPTDGALVRLGTAAFADGPWCGDAPYRFDADLYRVRRIRLRVRLQADAVDVRGRDPLRFARPGTAISPAAEVPDVELVLDVSPVNLQVP